MMISNKEGGAPPCAHTALFATHPAGDTPCDVCVANSVTTPPANFPILIGTSGYDYPEWKGVFYPENLKRKDFLAYYATQFNALELNNTFYSMPTAEKLLSFYERSGGLLQFSIKANRLLTHEIDRNWQAAASDFIKAVGPLAEKGCLCALLFQFPQSFHYTDQNRIYLAKIIAEFQGFPVVIEFRHVEWIKESVLRGLDQRKSSLCFCDMPQLKALPDGKTIKAPFIGPIAYIRLHGRNADAWYSKAADSTKAAAIASVESSANLAASASVESSANFAATANGESSARIVTSANFESSANFKSSANPASARYIYDYSDSELAEFVPIIQNAIITGRKPVVFFNNHPNGSGAKNAGKLRELLQ